MNALVVFDNLLSSRRPNFRALIELFPAKLTEQQELYKEDGSDLAADPNVALLTPLVKELDPELNQVIESTSRASN